MDGKSEAVAIAKPAWFMPPLLHGRTRIKMYSFRFTKYEEFPLPASRLCIHILSMQKICILTFVSSHREKTVSHVEAILWTVI